MKTTVTLSMAAALAKFLPQQYIARDGVDLDLDGREVLLAICDCKRRND